jgi:hypothetical protein
MKIFIEKVEIRNEYSDGTIVELGIIGKTESGKEIEIFDDELFDLREYEGQWIECLIYGARGSEEEKYAVKGVFLRHYQIPQKMIEETRLPPNYKRLGFPRDKFLSPRERPAIKTEDGVILIYPERKLRDHTNTTYYISIYKLKAWYPVDE